MVQLEAKAHGKALVICGDTRPVKDFLKNLGGRWNGNFGGWMYPGSKGDSIISELRKASHEVVDNFAGKLPHVPQVGAPAAAGESGEPPAKKAKAEKATKKQQEQGVMDNMRAAIDVAVPGGQEPVKLPAAASSGQAEGEGLLSPDTWFAPLSAQGDKRRVSVTRLHNEVQVDIREWWGSDGDMKPGKKGIMLKRQEWEALKKAMTAVDEQLAKLDA